MRGTVFIFTKPNCRYCVQAKDLLATKPAVRVVEVPVTPEWKDWLVATVEAKTVPQVSARRAPGYRVAVTPGARRAGWLRQPPVSCCATNPRARAGLPQ